MLIPLAETRRYLALYLKRVLLVQCSNLNLDMYQAPTKMWHRSTIRRILVPWADGILRESSVHT
jgi:hypothetical protein